MPNVRVGAAADGNARTVVKTVGLIGKFVKTSIDQQFQDQVWDMVQPGTSALFLMLEKVTPDKAVEAMSKYGGTVLKTSLSNDDERELQDALHGGQAAAQ